MYTSRIVLDIHEMARLKEDPSQADTVLSAQDGLAAASHLANGALRGVKPFLSACRSTGAPDRTELPISALDALVAANIDVYGLDYTICTYMRFMGISPYFRDASLAILPESLRTIYRRVRVRHRNGFTPVFETVRAAILTSLKRRIPLDAEAVLPFMDTELRARYVGVICMPRPLIAVRTALWAWFTLIVVTTATLCALIYAGFGNPLPMLKGLMKPSPAYKYAAAAFQMALVTVVLINASCVSVVVRDRLERNDTLSRVTKSVGPTLASIVVLASAVM